MSSDLHTGHGEEPKRRFFDRRVNIVLIAFLAIAGFFLVTEHRAHLFGILPFLLILACPLLHIFMHRGHGRHGGSYRTDESKRPSADGAPHRH